MTDRNAAAAILEIIKTVMDLVKAAGEIPSGHLYAQLMPMGCQLRQYQQIESILIGSGKVRKSGDLLTWVG